MASYIPRLISSAIIEAHKHFPCITINGPRQSGKSTLCRHLFPDYTYVTLERVATRVFAHTDPQAFIKQLGPRAIIDEVQHVPELLSEIQVMVDEDRSLRYVLTGSSNFALLKSVTQSLAGRTAIFNLLPLSIAEIRSHIDCSSTSEMMLRGFYPGVIAEGIAPEIFYDNYYNSYVDRDLRGTLRLGNIVNFDKFLQLLALRVGSEFNASALAREIGVSSATISEWLSILDASYVIFRLPPYFNNPNKTLTKSPKIFFFDTGLLCNILNISSADSLDSNPLRGAIFENLAVAEMAKRRFNAGHLPRLYFYRERSGLEVDLLTSDNSGIHLYEIKSSSTFHASFAENMNRLSRSLPRVASRTVIYDGPAMPPLAINIRNL